MLKKKSLLFTLIVVALSVLPFAECQNPESNVMVTVDQPWWRTTGANQPTEFIAHGKGGTLPYTFQWYTTFLDPTISPEQWIKVPVPDSNSSTFRFVESTLGRYGISVNISDSNGDSEYQSFQPMGIVVTVQSSPVLQPSTTPSPTPSHSSNQPSSTLHIPTTKGIPNENYTQEFLILLLIVILVVVIIVTVLVIVGRSKAAIK